MWHMFTIQFFKPFSIMEQFFQNFHFFQKWGLRGSKNEFFKTNFQNQKGLQKLDTKHVPHSPKEDFQ